MQTFLPDPSFAVSASMLFRSHLGKQRSESKQILMALLDECDHWKPGAQDAILRHACTRLWKGHERLLCDYSIAICDEWIKRGYRDDTKSFFIERRAFLPECPALPWLDADFCSRHREALLTKGLMKFIDKCNDDMMDWYAQFGWSEQAQWDGSTRYRWS